MSSTFSCPVIAVKLEPHPNADSLSLVKIDGYQVVVKTEEWKDGQLAAYVPPDSSVPDRPEWAFLAGKFRIRTRRFRGEWSHGLLVCAPDGARVGDDVSSSLSVVPYEPPSARREGMSARERRAMPWYRRIISYYKEVRERPRGRFPYYDIENARRFQGLFQPGELIYVTEKIHGANALYTSKRPWYSRTTKIYMRSRTVWKHIGRRDWWQDAYRATPGIARLLGDFPGISIYGEVYGRGIQELEYGVVTPHFVGFDIWMNEKWMPQDEAYELMKKYDIPVAPFLYECTFHNMEDLYDMANSFKKSTLAAMNGADHITEGIVLQSLTSRKILKIVSDKYLETVK